jgi:DNA-3-methyladenine glycosylase
MILDRSFFTRDVKEVARELPGQLIACGDVVVRISEVEAYCGPTDTASHARFGYTKRNAVMWGQAGIAYVYLCYGVHNLFNIVTGNEGDAQAVLVRAAEAVAGFDTIKKRRGSLDLAGPGKVTQALGVDVKATGEDLCSPGGIEVRAGERALKLLVGPRVGIDFATPRDRNAKLRFALDGTDAVTAKKFLRRMR